jgi:hypothetical protein
MIKINSIHLGKYKILVPILSNRVNQTNDFYHKESVLSRKALISLVFIFSSGKGRIIVYASL